MLFNSAQFFAFLPMALLGHWALPHRHRNVFLTLASWYFYSFWSVRFVGLIVLSTTVDYWLARTIADTPDPSRKRALLTVSVVVNLGLLGFFKYYDFFLENVVDMFQALGLPFSVPALRVILPVGISFYTFQELSYTIDVYRGQCQARRNFFDFAAFVAFFPHMVAGPIMRADVLLRQLESRRRLSFVDVSEGAQLVLWGLFKKVVIADNLAPLADMVFAATPRAPLDSGLALLGSYVFAIQIYCDFSGYTDMARGIARFFGVELMRNFNLPYLAASMREFWQRWHISLSTWLRDYLYVSLGGNRGSRLRVSLNLFLTMLLGGLWHGASWMFVIWGAYHGLLLILERLRRGQGSFEAATGHRRWAGILVTFQLVCFSWVLFRSPDLATFAHWLDMLRSGAIAPEHWGLWGYFLLYASPLAFAWAIQARVGEDRLFVNLLPWYQRAIVIVSLYFGLTVLGADAGREFIYFQF